MISRANGKPFKDVTAGDVLMASGFKSYTCTVQRGGDQRGPVHILILSHLVPRLSVHPQS